MNEDVPNATVVQVNSIVDAPQHETAVHDSAQVHDRDRKDDAKSATFSPVRAFLLIPAALAFGGLFPFVVLPSGLRRQIYARRRGAEGGTKAQDVMEQKYLYMMDGGTEQVHVLDHASGKILSSFGRPGHQLGNFTQGHTLGVDSKGNIYVAETDWGRRIQKFKPVD